MTRDEHREKCIEAQKSAFRREFGDPKKSIDDVWAAAFDALNGIARVDPIEATEEMKYAGENCWVDPFAIFEAMSAAGDLTNPPEGKP